MKKKWCCCLLLLLAIGASTAFTSAQQRKVAGPATPYFLFLSDVHLDHFSSGTPDSGNINTGTVLWNNCKRKIGQLLDSAVKPAFVLFTGDMPAHYSARCYSCPLKGSLRDTHNINIRTVLTDLRSLVASDTTIPLLYVPGNNDGLDGDYFSFSDSDSAGSTPFSLVNNTVNPFPALHVAAASSKKAPHLLSAAHIGAGYYSVQLKNKLRVVVLNSIILGHYYYDRDGVPQDTAADTQLCWLQAQLQDAADQQQKVYLAMHIPPGIDAFAYDKHPFNADTATWAVKGANPWLNRFLASVGQYDTTVAGIFYGHTHMDELRRLYDSSGKPIQIAISCPGISPDHGNNPGFKLVRFDAGSKMPVDFITYYTHAEDTSWGNRTYQFSDLFRTRPDTPIFKSLALLPPLQLKHHVEKIFTVMNGCPSYNIASGLEVYWAR